MKLIAGDIGGTHTRLLAAEWSGDRPAIIVERHYRNDDFENPVALLETFRADISLKGPLDRACLALAGPVEKGEREQSVRLTNRPWSFHTSAVSRVMASTPTVFINDFEAVGWGLPLLEKDETQLLQPGTLLQQSPLAAIGAGSGLGMVVAVPIGSNWRILPSEGGHADLAAADEEEVAIVAALWRQFGHASWERVVSGPGIEFIYQHLCSEQPGDKRPLAAQEISQAALDGTNATAVHALERFCRIYGAQAGNLALTVLPRGGLFLAGGITPKVLHGQFLGAFMERFLAKGRLRTIVEKIPLSIITTERTGMMGAAHYAKSDSNL